MRYERLMAALNTFLLATSFAGIFFFSNSTFANSPNTIYVEIGGQTHSAKFSQQTDLSADRKDLVEFYFPNGEFNDLTFIRIKVLQTFVSIDSLIRIFQSGDQQITLVFDPSLLSRKKDGVLMLDENELQYIDVKLASKPNVKLTELDNIFQRNKQLSFATVRDPYVEMGNDILWSRGYVAAWLLTLQSLGSTASNATCEGRATGGFLINQ